MQIVLFKRVFSFYTAYAAEDDKPLFGEVKIILNLSLKQGVWFTVVVPNKAYSSRGLNIFEPILMALETQTVGTEKYTHLKDRCRAKRIWRQL